MFVGGLGFPLNQNIPTSYKCTVVFGLAVTCHAYHISLEVSRYTVCQRGRHTLCVRVHLRLLTVAWRRLDVTVHASACVGESTLPGLND